MMFSQRVLVPVNVIEGAVHLLVVLLRGPHPGLAEIDTEAPRFTMQPGERLTSVMAIGSQYPIARPGRTKIGAARDSTEPDWPDHGIRHLRPQPHAPDGKMQRQHTSVIGLTNRPSEGSAAALRLYPHIIRALSRVRDFTETSLFNREGLDIQPFTGGRRRDPRRHTGQAEPLLSTPFWSK
jgi:hypothetical protein